jgi:hypothetical protein
MKKNLYSIILGALALMMGTPLSAQYELLFLGNDDNPLDSMTMDYLQIEGYNVTFVSPEDFAGGLYATADGYADFDALFVSESIGSSSANNYLAAEFPIPCVVTEGYVVRSDKWGLLADHGETYFAQASSATLNADVLTMEITDNEHWITKDYELYDQIIWAETDDPTRLGVTSFLLSDDVDGAEPLAKFLFDMGGELSCMWAIPDGSTLHGTTTLPNMVFIGIIQSDVGQSFTYDFLELIRKSIQWVTDDYVAESVDPSEGFRPVVGPNPTTGLANISIRLPESGNVRVNIFDVAGKLMKSVDAGDLNTGPHTLQIDLSGLSDAQYIYEIRTRTEVFRGKIIKQ